jgi:hypothetical protein
MRQSWLDNLNMSDSNLNKEITAQVQNEDNKHSNNFGSGLRQ